MNKQFENMQKLAFGKILINESTKKMTKSAFTTQIKEMILNEMNETKKVEKDKKDKKDEADVAPQEDVDINVDSETPPAETPTDTMAAPEMNNDIVRDIQNLLLDAFKKAQQLPDNEDKQKTVNQISNTVKMFMSTQVLGNDNQPVAEISQGLAARTLASYYDNNPLIGDQYPEKGKQADKVQSYVNPTLASEIKKLGFDQISSGMQTVKNPKGGMSTYASGVTFIAKVLPGFGGGKARVIVTPDNVEVLHGAGNKIIRVDYLENAVNANIAVKKIQQDLKK